MITAALALSLCLIGPLLQDKTASLPAAEASQLRSRFAEALTSDTPKTRATLLALGRKLEARYAFDDLRDALREGPLLDKKSLEPRRIDKQREELARFGNTTVGYTFACEAGVFRYAVDCPSDYDPSKPAAVLLDPGHGTGKGKSDEEKAGFLAFYRGQCERAGLDSWLIVRTEILEQVGADGLRGALPEDRVAGIFQALWRDVASRWSIDPDRLYVSGLSQTGFWSWYLGRASADRYAGIAPMSAVTWQVEHYAANFMNLPVFVLHGELDKPCPVEQPRATCAKLQQLGFSVKYVEVPGKGHDIGTWSGLHEGLAGLALHPRKRYARKVAKSFETLADPWCGFLRVEGLEREGDGKAPTRPTASLEAEFEGQVLRLKSKGIPGAKLFLASELADLSQPIEVIWNEKRVFQGKAAREFTTMLEVALERADWTQTFEAAIELRCP